jgi:hypothetical protein
MKLDRHIANMGIIGSGFLVIASSYNALMLVVPMEGA